MVETDLIDDSRRVKCVVQSLFPQELHYKKNPTNTGFKKHDDRQYTDPTLNRVRADVQKMTSALSSDDEDANDVKGEQVNWDGYRGEKEYCDDDY